MFFYENITYEFLKQIKCVLFISIVIIIYFRQYKIYNTNISHKLFIYWIVGYITAATTRLSITYSRIFKYFKFITPQGRLLRECGTNQ